MKYQADKLTISLEDHRDISEFFGRKSPGEKIKCMVEASIDEVSDGVVALSVDEVKIHQTADDVPMSPEDEGLPAIKVFKGRKKKKTAEPMEEETF